MHWKHYRETAGKPPTHEVVIQYDKRDADHPFLLGRIKHYADIKEFKVVLRPVDGRTTLEKINAAKNDPRTVAQPSS